MLEATVTVVRIDGSTAWVAGESRSACGGCASAGHCGTGVLAALIGRRRLLAVHNRLYSRVGDRLVIGVSDRVLTRASLLAYLLPLLCMVAPAILCDARGLGNVPVAVASLAGLSAGLGLLALLGRDSRHSFRPQVIGPAPQQIESINLNPGVLQ